MVESIDLLTALVRIKEVGLKKSLRMMRRLKQEAKGLERIKLSADTRGITAAKKQVQDLDRLVERLQKKAKIDFQSRFIRARGAQPAVFRSNFVGTDALERSAASVGRKQRTEASREAAKLEAERRQQQARRFREIRNHERRALAERRRRAKEWARAEREAAREALLASRQAYRLIRNHERRALQARRQAAREAAKLEAERRQQQARRFREIRNHERRALAERRRRAKEWARAEREAAREVVLASRQAYRLIRNHERRALQARRQAARDLTRRRQDRLQALNSISLEAGFLGVVPGAQTVGNLFRIAGAATKVGSSFGLARKAAIAFGVGISAMAGAAAAATKVLSLLASGLLRVVRFGFSTFARGIAFLLSPTLTFVRLLARMANNLTLVGAIAAGIVGRQLYVIGTQFERIGNQFRFAFGPDAVRQFREVERLSDRLGLSLGTSAEQYAKTSVAARGAGIAQKDVESLFRGIGRASLALGLDQERTNGIFFAFEQIISKGKVSAEEIRRQLGDRLPGAFGLAARAIGKTTAEFDKLLEQGKVDSATFIPAIARQLNREFFVASLVQSRSLIASVNRLVNAFGRLVRSISGRAVTQFSRLVRGIARILDELAKGDGVKQLAGILSTTIDTLSVSLTFLVSQVSKFAEIIGPTLASIAKAMVVLNAVAFATFVTILEQAAEKLRGITDLILEASAGLSGFKLEKFNDSLAAALAILENIDSVMKVIKLRLLELPTRLQFLTEALSGPEGFFSDFRKAAVGIGGAIAEGFVGGLLVALRSSGLLDIKLPGLAEIPVRVKQAFDAIKSGNVREAFDAIYATGDTERMTIGEAIGAEARINRIRSSLSSITLPDVGEMIDKLKTGLEEAWDRPTGQAKEIAKALTEAADRIRLTFLKITAKANLQNIGSYFEETGLKIFESAYRLLAGGLPSGSPEASLAAAGTSGGIVDIAGLRDQIETGLELTTVADNTGRTADSAATIALLMQGVTASMREIREQLPIELGEAILGEVADLYGRLSQKP